MSIVKGLPIADIFKGETQIIEVYSGDALVWSKGFLKGILVGPGEAQAGDIVLCNKKVKGGAFIKVRLEPNNPFAGKFYLSDYEPIGVVAIPEAHGIYGNPGSLKNPIYVSGVISLVDMAWDTPDTGKAVTDANNTYYGGQGQDVGLPFLQQAPSLGSHHEPSDVITGFTNNGLLPSDVFTGDNDVPSPHDPKARYHLLANASHQAIPSPYSMDGGRNPLYYQTASPSTALNCFADFDGKGNTEKLLSHNTRQTNWKTEATILNIPAEGSFPLACCTWRYHTEGTSQGDWYLPSAGELGYVVSRLKAIQDSIQAIIDAGGRACLLTRAGEYRSSTQYSTSLCRNMDFENTYIGSADKNQINPITSGRAFMQLQTKSGLSGGGLLSDPDPGLVEPDIQ